MYAAVIILIIVILVVYFKSRKRPQSPPSSITYEAPTEATEDDIGKNYRQKYILTRNEYSFYNQLLKVSNKRNWIICPKVDLKSIFEVTNKAQYRKYFLTIAQKHVDFLICDNALRPLYAIDLAGGRTSTDQEKSVLVKESIFANSNIKLINIASDQTYTEESIDKYFQSV